MFDFEFEAKARAADKPPTQSTQTEVTTPLPLITPCDCGFFTYMMHTHDLYVPLMLWWLAIHIEFYILETRCAGFYTLH